MRMEVWHPAERSAYRWESLGWLPDNQEVVLYQDWLEVQQVGKSLPTCSFYFALLKGN